MKATADRKAPAASGEVVWSLRLYVAGKTQESLLAYTNLKQFCQEHLVQEYRIEVIDVAVQPERAREDNIVALPTLVLRSPKLVRKVIGDLSDTARLQRILDA